MAKLAKAHMEKYGEEPKSGLLSENTIADM